MTIRQSLLDAPTNSAIGEAAQWFSNLVSGSLAQGLAVLGFGLLGFLLLGGKLPLRRAGSVVIGTFLLFGAPVIAAGLLTSLDLNGIGTFNLIVPASPTVVPAQSPPQPGRSDPFDPYR